MLVIIWIIGTQLQVHYQQSISSGIEDGEWSWGPADGAFLVPITEIVALSQITRPDAQIEVHDAE